VARDVFHVDQTGLGYLTASFASGAFSGSIMLSSFGARLPPGRTMLVAAAIWYGWLIVFAQMTMPLPGAVLLFLAGFAQSMSMVPLVVMLLRTSQMRLRGRVMGVRMLAIYSLPLGLLLAGWTIPQYGFHVTATCYAVFGLVCTLLIGIYWRRDLWDRQAKANAL
jgi:predicted MFS family arabinose efflux permease